MRALLQSARVGATSAAALSSEIADASRYSLCNRVECFSSAAVSQSTVTKYVRYTRSGTTSYGILSG